MHIVHRHEFRPPFFASRPSDFPGVSAEDIVVLCFLLIFDAAVVNTLIKAALTPPGLTSWKIPGFVIMLLVVGICVSATIVKAMDMVQKEWYRRSGLAWLRTETLPQRTEHAAEMIHEATRLVEELQTELADRTALLEHVRHQAAETTQRITDMEELSQLSEQTKRTLNKYFDELLKKRLETLEYGARRRDWLLGTVGALAFGIIAILLSHYLFGF
jgi:hypothetical protein